MPTGRLSSSEPPTTPPATVAMVDHHPPPQPLDAVFPDRTSRLPTSAKPASDASINETVQVRSPEGVQVTGPLDPPRDPMSAGAQPAAVVDPRRIPTVMRASLGLWTASFLAGFVAMALSFRNLPELRAGLVEIARQRQPDVEADVADDAVSILLYGAVGGTVLLISLQAVLAVLVGTRRSWARVLLTVVAVLSLPVLILTRDVVSGQARSMLVLEALLVLAALVTMFLPAANSWFRQQRVTRRGVQDELPAARLESR